MIFSEGVCFAIENFVSALFKIIIFFSIFTCEANWSVCSDYCFHSSQPILSLIPTWIYIIAKPLIFLQRDQWFLARSSIILLIFVLFDCFSAITEQLAYSQNNFLTSSDPIKIVSIFSSILFLWFFFCYHFFLWHANSDILKLTDFHFPSLHILTQNVSSSDFSGYLFSFNSSIHIGGRKNLLVITVIWVTE